MVAKDIQLTAEVREGGASKVRSLEQVPAVLYGHGVKNQSLAVDAKQFGKAFASAGHNALVDLVVGKDEHNVLIKDIQRHPTRSHITHVDFYQVNLKEKVRANVPVTFTGESAAIKYLGGIFVRNIDELEVEALPRDLPREIVVDISGLAEYNQAIRIDDISMPKGVEPQAEGDAVICLVQAPRTEEELESLEEEVSENVESVEGVKKEEAEDEAAEEDAAAEKLEGDSSTDSTKSL